MASIETLERHQTMASELLAQEARRPTIDAAVKSFLSLYTARAWTSTSTAVTSSSNNNNSNGSGSRQSQPARDQRSPSLPLTEARLLLKTINQYTFPLLPEPSDEYKVVAQLWNGLVASNQKPTKFLGARSLALAYQYGLAKEIKEQQLKQQQQQANDGDDDANGRHSFCESDFLKEFQSLLLEYQTLATATGDSSRAKCTTASATTPTGANGDEQPSSATPAASVLATTTTTTTAVSSFDNGRDSDACLIWDADRGHAELARRRARRAERAKVQMAESVAQEQQQQEQSSSSVTIEEIDEPSSTS